jgi:hypothetical protein
MLLVFLIVLPEEQSVHCSSQPKNFLQHVESKDPHTNNNSNMQARL